MADISGLIDITEGHDAEIIVTDHGSVLLDIDATAGLRFRTLAAFDAWCERLDRKRAAMGYAQTFEPQVETAEYHERFQSLCAERGELAAPRLRQVSGDV